MTSRDFTSTRTHLLLTAIITTSLAGCQPPPPVRPMAPPTNTTPAASPHSQDQAGAATNDSPKATIELKPVDWKAAQELVATQQGKVVVLDVWSTSCEPCLAEFPHLVTLQKQHGGDVVCLALNCDFIGAKNKPVDYYHERVLAALNDLKASNVINLISTVASDELFQEMDLDSIPAVYVFGRDGKLAKRFDNRTPAGDGHEGISYEKQINPLVAELVKVELGK